MTLTKEEIAGVYCGTILGIFLWCLKLAAVVVIALWTAHFAVKFHIAPPMPCDTVIERTSE